jgi:secondary thiamine-phosphate synthase enzyme
VELQPEDGRLQQGTSWPLYHERGLTVHTEGACVMHDITDEVAAFVQETEIAAGMVLLLSLHTTAGLLVNESETGLRADFRDTVDRVVPRDIDYRHDDLDVRWENLCPEDAEAPNGHSHLQHVVFSNPSVVLPVNAGRLALGQWQRVFLIEFDRPRRRSLRMHAFGLGASVPALGAVAAPVEPLAVPAPAEPLAASSPAPEGS